MDEEVTLKSIIESQLRQLESADHSIKYWAEAYFQLAEQNTKLKEENRKLLKASFGLPPDE